MLRCMHDELFSEKSSVRKRSGSARTLFEYDLARSECEADEMRIRHIQIFAALVIVVGIFLAEAATGGSKTLPGAYCTVSNAYYLDFNLLLRNDDVPTAQPNGQCDVVIHRECTTSSWHETGLDACMWALPCIWAYMVEEEREVTCRYTCENGYSYTETRTENEWHAKGCCWLGVPHSVREKRQVPEVAP